MKKLLALICLLIIFPLNVKSLSTSASQGILMDMESKRIFYSKDIHKVKSVASISKIMTAILTIENIDVNKEITVGDEINTSYGSGIYIKKGEKLKIIDLLYGLMLRSGNDASLSLAKNTLGSVEKFVIQMNNLAKKIGMKNTTFNNPNGLDEEAGNYSTVYDMALLTSYASQNELYQKIVSTKKYTLKTNMNTYIWYNKHRLVNNYKYATGGKTGFTKIAKRTLVTTACKEGLNLVAVTFNDGNDFLDHQNLFEEVFKNYKNYVIVENGDLEIDDDFYKILYTKKEFKYPLSKEEVNTVKVDYELEKVRSIKEETKVGVARIYLGDEEIGSIDIYTNKKIDNKVEKIGFFQKIKRWFSTLW